MARPTKLTSGAAGSDAARPLWILEPGPDQLSGGWLFAVRLAKAANRDITVVCPTDSRVYRVAREAGIRVADCEFPRPAPSQAVALLRSARRLRSRIPPDAVVISGAIRASLVALMARLPNPIVHLMHERDSANRRSVKLALRHSQSVVVVGADAARAYRRALPHAGVTAVNNFLGTDELADLARVRDRRVAASDDARPILGVIARLVPEKGVDVLIDELATNLDAWSRLLIAGDRQDPAYAQRVEDRVARNGLSDRVMLLGARTDVPAVLAQLDALVVPSIGNEGQPTVIIEALAAGLPVLVREGVVGDDFRDLPVSTYGGMRPLGLALLELPGASADLELIATRFGIGQILAGLDAAAARATG